MRTADFDFELPEKLIAQEPVLPRDQCRLLVVRRDSNQFEHRKFYEIKEFLSESDLLVLNDSRVIPARLYGRKSTGAKVEVLLIERIQNGTWKAIVKPGSKIKKGSTLVFDELSCKVVEHLPDSTRVLEFNEPGAEETIKKIGKMPIPPYIKKYPKNPELYQTVYAKAEGSVAAPTAGLHFTKELLSELQASGVNITYITLHVGLGTFRPVKVDKIENHKMHSEFYTISEKSVKKISETRQKGGKVIAVGTTVVRTLEAVAAENAGNLIAKSGYTDIFIYPPFKFNVVDGIITNFHLPRSTLLMLVSAFAGREKILNAYREAVKERYRFFSFGDACMIL
ncbi:MAG: tRNA preQ1(34) S-adenosylmethionine ribosyltransferase-isomerase QueA [Kosmotoga sp.]|uniref:tRNA preQ1(34) S-adenosylmethionine ribosyltransferase-isomerase QueA n=1 Tax=Kosmotoga sp. TaxID=1955248 RepID=UPI001DCE798F|nr:tRNA preQ1(34) S-adenosylmethionine ribosyltransferase-isomerase QueA [Kosmotoga sp.]MBO8166101.1 tRNA preQ1(34) S-adenosylmethionine ribosyltransferase-isomerase QueA [Kosmotoga sp.]